MTFEKTVIMPTDDYNMNLLHLYLMNLGFQFEMIEDVRIYILPRPKMIAAEDRVFPSIEIVDLQGSVRFLISVLRMKSERRLFEPYCNLFIKTCTGVLMNEGFFEKEWSEFNRAYRRALPNDIWVLIGFVITSGLLALGFYLGGLVG